MKKLLAAALVTFPLLTLTTPARAEGTFSFTIPGCPWKVEAGANAYFRMTDGCLSPQAGPWYLYWPLEAHFGPPAPTGYPFWPNTMTLPPNTHGPGPTQGYAPPGPMPPMPQGAPPAQRSSFQPVSYSIPVPGYWYGR